MRPAPWISVVLLATACMLPVQEDTPPRASRPVPNPPAPPPAPVVVRDTLLEQRVARLELRLLEKEAQVEELQGRLDDARREVVRAMAKLQSLATRAEAASGMAEAEIALQTLRSSNATVPEVAQVAQLLQLAAAEFDRENYAGSLYLATQAKTAAGLGQGRLVDGNRGQARPGEVAFALPLRVVTTDRANVREGPSGRSAVSFTLERGSPIVAYSYVEQWVRVTDEADRPGWIHQSLLARRP